MSTFSKLEVKDKDIVTSLQGFFKTLLESKKIDAFMVPWHLPMKEVVMPTLISDVEQLDKADPLAPSFPMNAAKIASRLTKKPAGQTIALVMRSCEIRAFIELIKLKQGSLDNTVLIGIDCLGAFDNRDYASFAKKEVSTVRFCDKILKDKSENIEGLNLAAACKVCEHPVPDNADIIIGLYGIDYQSELLLEAPTVKGEELLQALNLPKTSESASRQQAIKSLISDREAKRDKMFEETSLATSNIEKLSGYLASCVNCYNCRVACPVCYCRECVFVTDVFDHDSFQYLQWAKKKGRVKMPTDTDLFHLTRMAHISLACVGCGQCSNACPNDIPLTELFRTVSHHTQKAFEYEAGKNIEEPIPLSVFNDKEYEEVVGINKQSTE